MCYKLLYVSVFGVPLNTEFTDLEEASSEQRESITMIWDSGIEVQFSDDTASDTR